MHLLPHPPLTGAGYGCSCGAAALEVLAPPCSHFWNSVPPEPSTGGAESPVGQVGQGAWQHAPSSVGRVTSRPDSPLTLSVPTGEARELLARHLADLEFDAEIVVWDGHGPAPEAAGRIALFTGLYNAPPPPREVFAALPALQVIQLLSAGVEPWLPVVPEGVVLCNGRGIHGSSTAELAIGGLLALLRDLPAYLDAQREGRWQRLESRGLAGQRVLVLGAGDIGRRIGAVAETLDAEVTYVARTERVGIRALADVPELLPDHHVVVVALPLTPETERIVDAGFLAAMPDGAALVNISRGRHVDTDALVEQLRQRRLRAFLDVTDPEPLPEDHPLWEVPNLILTPHVGGGTAGWDDRAYELVAEQAQRLRDGGTDALANRVDGGY